MPETGCLQLRGEDEGSEEGQIEWRWKNGIHGWKRKNGICSLDIYWEWKVGIVIGI